MSLFFARRARAIVPFLFSVLFILQTVSCSTYSTVRYLTANKTQFQQGNFAALAQLTRDMLRTADDDKNGTLYYGGLLLYFNGFPENAETALRRSARTSREPWARESARLVAYFMVLDHRYNQIRPFLESIFALEQIKTDPELYYYYSLALFLDEDCGALAKLLSAAPEITVHPAWQYTLRSRVSARTASFSYDLWTALLPGAHGVPQQAGGSRVSAKDAGNALYDVLVSYQVQDMPDSVDVFIDKIYPQMSGAFRAVLNAKLALQTQRSQNNFQKSATAADLFFSLPPDVFINPAMAEDLLSSMKKLRRSAAEAKHMRRQALSLFDAAYERAETAEQRVYLDIVRGHLYYEQNNYQRSFDFYKRAFADGETAAAFDLGVQNRALWRMLLSGIKTNSGTFLPMFDEVISRSKTPEYFSNVLEEYLVVLLQRSQYVQLAKDAAYLREKYSSDTPADRAVRSELARWYFILSRAKTAANAAKDASFNLNAVHRRSTYTSDAPFEYLFATDDVAKEKFIQDWIISNAEKKDAPNAEEKSGSQPDVRISQNVPQNNERELMLETFARGYLDFGLYEYAAEVIEENIQFINAQTLRLLLKHFVEQKNTNVL